MPHTAPWAGQWIVVSGGTSGLGLQLVIAASEQRARVAIVGRDRGRLESAVAESIKRGAASALGFSVDLRHRSAKGPELPEDDCDKLRLWLGQHDIHLLLNVVGRSDRGALEQLTTMDLLSMLDDNVLSVWNMTRMALDSLKRSRGVIVNIGSLAGIVAAPNMGGYSIAKSALTAMSRQLRLELELAGVHVLLVCPGPVAREDSDTRYNQLASARGIDDGISAPGAGVKLKAIDPVVLSRRILAAAKLRRKEVITPSKAAWLAAIASLVPNWSDWILKKYTKP